MKEQEKKVNGDKKKKPRKLSPQEIELAVEKIRRLYDDYMVRHVKNRRAREAFEQRYLDARNARVGLDRFVVEELRWIQRLDAQAKEERQEARRKRGASGGSDGDAEKAPKESFADRVLAELRSRVEKYPPVGLEVEEVFEVDKLYGALGVLEANHWPKIDRIYRKVYPSRYSGPRIILENRFFELSEPTSGRLPQRLQVLIGLLGRFPRNYREIEWEVKQCILTASFFLHLFKDELALLKEEDILSKGEREAVEKSYDFVHTVIEDFRLTDLKEKK